MIGTLFFAINNEWDEKRPIVTIVLRVKKTFMMKRGFKMIE